METGIMNENIPMTEVKPVAVTKHHVPCPWCGGNASTVDHLLNEKHATETQWACDACGEKIALKVKDGRLWTGKVRGERTYKTLVLLRHGDIGLVVEGMAFEDHPGSPESYYDENTCPTNYLKHVKVIIDLKRNDTDPHGIFQFVAVRPYDPRIEECNLSDDELAKIIGLDQFQLLPPA